MNEEKKHERIKTKVNLSFECTDMIHSKQSTKTRLLPSNTNPPTEP